MKYLILTLIISPMFVEAQSNQKFQHTEYTNADPSVIWKVWTDVSHWNEWDNGLKSAELYGSFGLGAKGKLVPDKGPRSKFKITEFQGGVSYAFKTRIPFGWLIVRRVLKVQSGKTVFTHEVEFTGLLRRPISNSIGKRYREMLPEVMKNIKRIAETKNTIE